MFDKRKRLIFHLDVNSAFLSWEAAYRLHHLGGQLDLREVPSAVAGDQAMRRGIILAKSIPAKRFGIQTGMSIVEALQRCPKLYLVPPNYSLYQSCSSAVMHIMREYTPWVEQYSIDEAFMDMTELGELYPDPVETAGELRRRISDELGFTVNVGISCNKVLAKMAGELKKPNLVHTLFPEEIPEKLWPLPVSELFFVGRATTKKLYNMGIRTIGELARTDPGILEAQLKHQGGVVWAFANGLDCSAVEAEAPPQKGYGNSTTIPFDVEDAETAKKVLLALAETVARRLREDRVRAEVVSVSLKGSDLHSACHQVILDNPTNITRELHCCACRLFDELWDRQTPIRQLGIHTSRLSRGEEMRQLHLFDSTDYGKLERADAAVDRIRRRFGIDAVKRAVFLSGPIDHLEGGVSREKRTVDYTGMRID